MTHLDPLRDVEVIDVTSRSLCENTKHHFTVNARHERRELNVKDSLQLASLGV